MALVVGQEDNGEVSGPTQSDESKEESEEKEQAEQEAQQPLPPATAGEAAKSWLILFDLWEEEEKKVQIQETIRKLDWMQTAADSQKVSGKRI